MVLGVAVDVSLALSYTYTTMVDMEETEAVQQTSTVRQPITWDAHEYLHTDKDHDWYWALGLIAVAGAVASLLFSNVLFAILILISAFVLAVFASRKPNLVTFAVTQRGVRIDDALYPYQSLTSFGIDDSHPTTPKLILESRKKLAPKLTIPIEADMADDIHDFLINFLPEEDHAEPLTHRVMEYLGF